MAAKIRKQIYIDSEHEAVLKQLSSQRGISEAEIIRQAVERYSLAAQPTSRNLKAWEEEKAFIQQRIDQSSTPNSTCKDRTWNREDLYDRKVLRGY
jgi:hypothetical protein